jgi:hypothetical protein
METAVVKMMVINSGVVTPQLFYEVDSSRIVLSQ